MRADCMLTGRCPTCTSVLPCEHFEDMESIIKNGWFPKIQWDCLPTNMQEIMINLKKELSGSSTEGSLIIMKRDLTQLQGMNQALQAKDNYAQFAYIRLVFGEYKKVRKYI